MFVIKEPRKEQLHTSLHQVPSAPIIWPIAVAGYNKRTRGRKDKKSDNGCETHVGGYLTWMFGNRSLRRKKKPAIVIVMFREDLGLYLYLL